MHSGLNFIDPKTSQYLSLDCVEYSHVKTSITILSEIHYTWSQMLISNPVLLFTVYDVSVSFRTVSLCDWRQKEKKSTWRVRSGVSKVNSQLMFDCNDPVNKWQHDGHRQGHRLLLVTKSGAAFSVQRQMFSSSINGAEFRNLMKSQLNMSRQIGVSLSHSLLPSLWCSGSSVTGIREMRAALIFWVASVRVSSSWITLVCVAGLVPRRFRRPLRILLQNMLGVVSLK